MFNLSYVECVVSWVTERYRAARVCNELEQSA